MTDFFPEFEDWGGFVSSLDDSVDLDTTAREAGAFQLGRKVADAQSLLRLAMHYGPCGLSLRPALAWAASAGIAELSDVGVLERLRRSENRLETICQILLADKFEVSSPGRPIVSLVDGTTVTGPGKNGQEWRLHCRYAASVNFKAIEITDRHSGESYKHFPVQGGILSLATAPMRSHPGWSIFWTVVPTSLFARDGVRFPYPLRMAIRSACWAH